MGQGTPATNSSSWLDALPSRILRFRVQGLSPAVSERGLQRQSRIISSGVQQMDFVAFGRKFDGPSLYLPISGLGGSP